MRVERLVLEGVGPFASLDLTFPPGSDPEKADVYLLVGPNGSGKSTLLYAIAKYLSQERAPLHERLWSDYLLILSTSGGRFGIFSKGKEDRINRLVALFWPDKKPWSDEELEEKTKELQATHAFGYSPHRTIRSGQIESIRGVTIDPRQGALTFSHSTESDTEVLVQWLANTFTRALLAAARGDEATAAQRRASITRLEEAIARITGRTIAFGMSEDPLGVTLKWQGRSVALGVLPEGLKAILGWLGDLLMRLEALPGDAPVNEREFVLLLDEIEAHLHPKWQRQIVPVLQSLFPKAQVFLATHSPFVVASADDAHIFPLSIDEQGLAHAGEPVSSRIGHSYAEILASLFGVSEEFDVQTEAELAQFRDLRTRRLKGEDVGADLDALATRLSQRSPELANLIGMELRALQRRLKATG